MAFFTADESQEVKMRSNQTGFLNLVHKCLVSDLTLNEFTIISEEINVKILNKKTVPLQKKKEANANAKAKDLSGITVSG